MDQGTFIISLDFELMWGVRDTMSIDAYRGHIEKVYEVIPRLLDLFDKYDINATFAIVGMLFSDNKKDLEANFPLNKPNYEDAKYSPYNNAALDEINKATAPLFFCPSLIKLLNRHPNHEISTHTFSHYYCLEKGQNVLQFKEDLFAAKKMASKYNVELRSIVFPRNQYSAEYLKVCNDLGISSFRGNETSWFYATSERKKEGYLKRGFRLMDAYINLSGTNSFKINFEKSPIDLPSSRFLRPYSKTFNFLEPIRVRRILTAMTKTAKKREAFHLWWHPHNFGANMEENFSVLEEILTHYKSLNEQFEFSSMTMQQAARIK